MRTSGKKGSLQLSINAIVILVLAIVMLGLGITFTRNMFGDLQGQLIEKTDFENVPEASFDSPVSFENNKVRVEHGSQDTIGFKVLNTLLTPADVYVYSEKCGIDATEGTDPRDPYPIFFGYPADDYINANGVPNDDIATRINVQSGEQVEMAVGITAKRGPLVSAGEIKICDLTIGLMPVGPDAGTEEPVTFSKTLTIVSE